MPSLVISWVSKNAFLLEVVALFSQHDVKYFYHISWGVQTYTFWNHVTQKIMMKKPHSYFIFSTFIFHHVFIFLQSLLIHYNFIKSVRTKINLLYAQRFVSYHAEDTVCFQYKNQTVNAV